MSSTNFSSRFMRTAQKVSPLCVGFDPSTTVLQSWGLAPDAQGAAQLCRVLLDALDGLAGIVKPQVAFFESFGPEGMQVLARFISEAKSRDLLVIADAKRGDIGSSMEAYASAWLGPESAFGADAVTASPYLGPSALSPLFRRAASTETAVFVVVRSSNPEGASVQSAMTQGRSVALDVATSITAWNDAMENEGDIGPVGAVVGATGGAESATLLDALSRSLFLSPGIGAQGATMQDAHKMFGSSASRVIPTVSRSILSAGPDRDRLRETIAGFARSARLLQEQGR
jgi:orotidine-5'-phosphate decarboxylase